VNRRARGDRYEQAALRYLKNKNYRILKTNFRSGRKEIDIICLDKDELVFVEVKGARSTTFGDPVFRVDERKRQALAVAAEGFLAQSARDYKSCRFDVVLVREEQHLQVEHLQNAFTL
jgi:putative endonuclease